MDDEDIKKDNINNEKDTKADDFDTIMGQVRDALSESSELIEKQRSEIDDLKKQIEELKKNDSEPEDGSEDVTKDDFAQFKDEIKKMLQQYNRTNPSLGGEEKQETFEENQMKLLGIRRF
jgi:chromosome segregation ATPase